MPEDTDELELLFAEARTTRLVLDEIGSKWSVVILMVLCCAPSRFNVIKRHLQGITHKALTEALRRLERNGLITRRVLDTSPVAVEYSITPLGRTLETPFSVLYAWSLEHIDDVQAAQRQYDLERGRP